MDFAPPFAVYINSNAKRVNKKLLNEIEELVPPDDIYLSYSLNDTDKITFQIIQKDYQTVFTGGGDGTITHFINQVNKYASFFPKIGILTLGTGNAVARLVSSGNPVSDLKTYISNPSCDYEPFSVVQSEGEIFLFAGLGWDAELLNYYEELKKKFTNRLISSIFKNAGGYFSAFFLKQVPAHIIDFIKKSEKIFVRIINRGERAYRINSEEKIVETFYKGDTIYEGISNMTIFGTVPYYGYGMKLLPFSTKFSGMMHLRVAALGVAKLFFNLPKIWKGEFFHPQVYEFCVEKVSLEFSDKVPYQVAGDARGYRKNIDFQVIPSAINFLKFI